MSLGWKDSLLPLTAPLGFPWWSFYLKWASCSQPSGPHMMGYICILHGMLHSAAAVMKHETFFKIVSGSVYSFRNLYYVIYVFNIFVPISLWAGRPSHTTQSNNEKYLCTTQIVKEIKSCYFLKLFLNLYI